MVDLDQSSSAYVFSRVTYHTPSNLQADVNIRLLGEGRGVSLGWISILYNNNRQLLPMDSAGSQLFNDIMI